MSLQPKDEMQYLSLYFQVHQPRRLRKFQFFDVGSETSYFDDALNKEILCRIADECYLPANKMLLDLIAKFPQVRVTFSISGVALEQFSLYAPSVIESFRQLAETGCVEFLAETYYHSLSYFIDREEFIDQVALHRQKIFELVGFFPQVARNTELVYSDSIGETLSDLNFRGVFVDGIETVLNGRTPNALYRHPSKPFVLFPRNFRLSDDIAFRYADPNLGGRPLTGDTFADRMNAIPLQEKFVCLGLDYETFGEHKKANTGIFEFFRDFAARVIRDGRFTFITPSEAIEVLPFQQTISTTKAISWADEARDLSAWLGNAMQRDAFDSLYKLHDQMMEAGSEELMNSFRHLQTSDHFYYMSTKNGLDGKVHQYFSPYDSPYEAFMNFMNIVLDLEFRLKKETGTRIRSRHDRSVELKEYLEFAD